MTLRTTASNLARAHALLFLCACGPETPAQDSDASSPDVGVADLGPDAHDAPADAEASWQPLTLEWPAALMGVHGRSHDDVWVVGARDTLGPSLLHWDGARWERRILEVEGAEQVDLWWVHALPDGEVLVGGGDGALYSGGLSEPFRRQDTPSLARQTVFGVWGDPGTGRVYAVGGIGARSGFVWERGPDGATWRALPLPADMPKLANGAHAGVFKVWGDGEGKVWFVGARGAALEREDEGPIELIETPTTQTLFTVVHDPVGDRALAVGGGSEGIALDLSRSPAAPVPVPPAAPLIQGVAIAPDGALVAVGARATTLTAAAPEGDLEPAEWAGGADLSAIDSLHAVWVDPEGSVWSVGGDVLSSSLSKGAILYRGSRQVDAVASSPQRVTQGVFVCPEEDVRRGAHSHVARRWIEQNLGAIRRSLPEPGVHARNLYHVSLALFEAYASSTPGVDPVAFPHDPGRALSDAERDAAMSWAAYTVLTHRYEDAIGGKRTLACLDATLRDLGLEPGADDDVATFGRSIGDTIIMGFGDDGSLEEFGYQDPDYVTPNPPLEVDEPGVDVDDPTRWQPLDLAIAVSQNGIPLGSGVQGYIGPHWGDVRPFALTRDSDQDLYFPQATPLDDLAALRPHVVDVIQKTSRLTPANDRVMDASPAGYGNNPLGEDANRGHALNPATGRPYRPVMTPERDFGRVLAEYWADGPHSETPPGHWNVLAHQVMDHPAFDWRQVSEVQVASELEYALHLYLILNGALHDAAIAAWQLKRHTESSRPITLIRWMAALGQSSDPGAANYHEQGLPLIEGLIEVVTATSSSPGARHEHLAPYVGELAILSWPGAPGDAKRRTSGQAWIRAQEWSTYQPRTFVTPAFPGYVSGHSTFSRTAAEVLSVLTGSPYFPGGLHEYVAPQGATLKFENGPSQRVRLQWATYHDAADQAGQSRIWGGIHVLPDDLDGRRIGAQVGQIALDWARANLRALRAENP
jgi:hypothetical protein